LKRGKVQKIAGLGKKKREKEQKPEEGDGEEKEGIMSKR
jgi:hypothetical protein